MLNIGRDKRREMGMYVTQSKEKCREREREKEVRIDSYGFGCLTPREYI